MNLFQYKIILYFFIFLFLYACGGSDDTASGNGSDDDSSSSGEVTGELTTIISEGFGSDFNQADYSGGEFVIENEVVVETTALTYVIVETTFSKIYLSFDLYFDTADKSISTKIFSNATAPSGYSIIMKKDLLSFSAFTPTSNEEIDETSISIEFNTTYQLSITYDFTNTSLSTELELAGETVGNMNLISTFSPDLNMFGFEIERGAYLDNLVISIES